MHFSFISSNLYQIGNYHPSNQYYSIYNSSNTTVNYRQIIQPSLSINRTTSKPIYNDSDFRVDLPNFSEEKNHPKKTDFFHRTKATLNYTTHYYIDIFPLVSLAILSHFGRSFRTNRTDRLGLEVPKFQAKLLHRKKGPVPLQVSLLLLPFYWIAKYIRESPRPN